MDCQCRSIGLTTVLGRKARIFVALRSSISVEGMGRNRHTESRNSVDFVERFNRGDIFTLGGNSFNDALS